MSSLWEQLIAAVVAAVIPVLVKFITDWSESKGTSASPGEEAQPTD